MESSPVSFPRSRWLGYLLRLCFIPVMRIANNRLARLDLNSRQYHLLYLARAHPGGYNQHSLAAEIGVTQNQAGDLIRELAERKLVEQQSNSSNHREKLVRLTDFGLKSFVLAEAVAAITQAELLNCLTELEQDELIRLLQKLAEGLAEMMS